MQCRTPAAPTFKHAVRCIAACACAACLGACDPTPQHDDDADSVPQHDAADTAPPASSLLPLADFPLDTLEPTVRRQISVGIADVESNPTDADTVGRLGMLYHTYEIYRLAQPCYERAVRLAPDAMRWRYYLGVVLRENGQPERAIEQFDAILNNTPDDAPTLMQRAAADMARNRFTPALADFEHVIRLQPDAPQAYCGAGRALLKLKRLEDAVASLRRSLALAPTYGRARYLLAVALRDLGKPDDAAEQFRLAETQRDDEPPVDDPLGMELENLATGAIEALHRGITQLQRGRVDAAVSLFNESLRLNPDLAETHANLGTALVMTGDLDAAATHLARALELQPGYAQAHYNLGLIAHRHADFAAAVEQFNAALATDPNHFESHLGLGIDLPHVTVSPADVGPDADDASGTDDGESPSRDREGAVFSTPATTMNDAENHLRAAARLRPDDPRPYKRLATLLTRRADFPETIRVLRAAVEHVPGDLTLINRLAWILATCPDDRWRRPQEAVALAESVCTSTRRRVPRPLDTLAAAYAAAGRFEDAVATATEAVASARAADNTKLLAAASERLALYKRARPFRLAGPRTPPRDDVRDAAERRP